jgi:hypothetical protein
MGAWKSSLGGNRALRLEGSQTLALHQATATGKQEDHRGQNHNSRHTTAGKLHRTTTPGIAAGNATRRSDVSEEKSQPELAKIDVTKCLATLQNSTS